MGYARYVGRVGGLAVALGVGVAVATTPGVAWADPSESDSTTSSSSSDSTSSSSGSNEGSGSTEGSSESSAGGEDAGSNEETGDSAVGEDASSGIDASEDSKKTTGPTVKDKKSGSDFSTSTPKKKAPKRAVVSTPSDTDVSTSESAADTSVAVQPKQEPVSAPPATSDVTVVQVTTSTTKTSLDEPPVVSEPESVDTPLGSTLLSAVGLAPSADGDVPEVPGDSPLLLAGLAAFRRQTQQSLVGDNAETLKVADPSQSSLMVAAANSAPAVAPVVGAPDQSTGAVVVSLNATDADGNPLTYAVTGQPTGGSLQELGGGQFRYTPSVASRLAAATTSTPDFDSFTVTVSDDQGGLTPVTLSVPKLPAVWANQPSSSNITGASPSGVAVVGDLAYVANSGTNTVTVINTKTGAVVGNPIVVGTAPTGVLANADGSRIYVANRTSGTISVIRTSDNTVVGSVRVGTNPEQMALNSTGTKLYVTNYGSSNVSVVNVSGQTPTLIKNIAVGANPRGIAFATVNGQPRVYVTRYNSSSVAVIDANTDTQIDVKPSTSTVDSITVGANPQAITVGPDGTRAYVTNFGANTVSVINTATNTVDGAAITVGSKPIGVSLSKDGSLLYVANSNDTVSVINTKTRATVATLQIDTAPETNNHYLTVRSDGSLVVTDTADKTVRVVALNRGNTVPVALANPGVGIANPTDGAITGSVNIKDWDGDPLTYSAVVSPTKGSLTFDATTGTYTYTPTKAARDAAAQAPATDRFTIRATDPYGAFKDTASVTVQISPTPSSSQIPVTVTPIAVTTSPSAVAISGNTAYVYGGDVISTIDTSTNTITDQTALYNDPPAITSDGRMYVPNPNLYYQGNAPYDSVDVINTTTGAVIRNIPIPICNDCAYANPSGPRDVVISPDGQRVYVSEDYYLETGIATTVVTIIDTRTDTVTGYFPTAPLSDMEIASDGKIYASSAEYPFVNVYNADMSQAGTISLTSLGYYYWSPTTALALNADKTRGYVVVQDFGVGQHVAVIDTAPGSSTRSTELAVITERSSALSPDGSQRYTVRPDGRTVDVYDTASNTVIGSFVTDQNAGSSPRSIAVAGDGTVYVTDMNDNKVYAVIVDGTQSALSFGEQSQARMMLASADTGSGGSMLMAAAASNSAPSVGVQPTGIPNSATGIVNGQVIASDADGNPLTYSVTGTSANGGSVAINSATGAYTYTPSPAARLAAGATTGADTDTFTVSVFDGQNTTTGTVAVYVSPTQLTVGTPIGVQRDPAGVAIYENAQDPTRNRTYVINQYDKSVSVIDGNPNSTTYNKVVATIKLASTPSDIVVNSTGTRAYVAMKGNATVTVIDTVANKVIDVNSTTATVDSIKVGSTPAGIAISPDDSRVYVTNSGSSTVSVIDTALNKEISRITVGSQPNGIAVSPDGKKLYVTLRYSDSLAVVDLATPTAAPALIKVGDSPREVVLTPVTGARAYVTNYDGTVSVIDTATKTQLTKITTGGPKLQPAGVAIDGTRGLVYVANGRDTVSVIDARTNAIVKTITIDSVAESGPHYVALSADGTRIYVTDYNDDNLRVLSLTRANTAPLAIADPTKGDVNPNTGTVMGLVNIKDPDGDALTFTTVSGATKGTVTYNAAAGTYAYTPSQAARDQAAQNPGLTDTFTIRATDPSGVYKDTVAITVTILPSVISGQPSGTSPRSANPVTGEVRGPVVVSGGGLSYTVVGAPTNGAVTVNSQGEYVYTPTLAARLAADLTTGPDTDSFMVRVTGPQTTQVVTVMVPVAPARVTVDSQFAPSLGTAPAGVDMNYRRAWIVNQADGTMSIIEVPGGYTVATLPVGTSPTSVAWNFDYAWVTNQGSNTVSVIDLVYNPGATQTLSGFNQPTDVLLDYPGIVFVSNKGNGTVVAIHPQTKQVLRTFQVGQSPTKMALTGVHLYVANSGSNSVSMIDLDTNTVSAPIPVGVNPTGLAVSPDGKWVYVTNQGSNTVSVINAATNTVVGSPIGVGSQPTSVVISPDSSLAYVANSDDTVSVIDTRTHTVVRTVSIDPNPEIGSHALSLSQASNYPYRDDDRIYVTDAADRTMRALAITPSPAPQLPAITTPITTGNSPGNVAVVGNYAYVVNVGSNTVTRIDTTTNTVVGAPITVGSYATAVAASPAAQRVYVADYYDNKVYAIDTTTNTVVGSYDVPVQQYEYAEWWNGLTGIKASRDGRRIFVTSADNNLTVIDTASNTVVGVVTAGADMEVSADGALLYLTTGGDAIAVYDTATMATVGEIHVGPYQYDSSRQIAISADGTRAYVTTSVVVVEAVDSYHTDQEVIRDNNDNLWRVHGRYDAVSVIDISDPASPTYNTEIASIPVVGGAGDVAVSSDGSRVYVTAADGKTVTVLDPNTKTVIGAVTTGQSPYGYQQVAVGANGTVYLTNGYDSSVYAVAVGSPQV